MAAPLAAARPVSPPQGSAPVTRAWTAAAAAVAGAIAIFFSPALLGVGQFLFRDAGRAYHPEKERLAAELRAGHLPEWNPHAGLGEPLVGAGLSAVQHPFNALFLAAPFERAFTLWVVLSYVLAGGGVVAWAAALGLRPAAAAVGALAFSLSGFLVSSSDNLIHLSTMAAAPWLLAAARRYAVVGGPLALAAVGAASYLCAAGGESLDWAVGVGLSAGQALLPSGGLAARARLRRAALCAGAAAVGAAPVILPLLGFLGDSSRQGAVPRAEAVRWNLHPLRLLELAVPGLVRGDLGRIRNEVYVLLSGDRAATPWTLSLYAGSTTLALAALAAARVGLARVALGAAALLAWAAMGCHAGFGWLAERLPVLEGVRYFERLAGWPTLLVAIAAACGAEQLLAGVAPRRRFAALSAAAAATGLAISAGASALSHRIAAAPGSAPPAAGALAANVAEGAMSAAVGLLLLAALVWLAARGHVGRAAPAALALVVALDVGGANARAYVLGRPEVVRPARAPIPEALAAHPALGRVTAPFALDAERWPELLPFESSWRWGALTAAPSFNLAWKVASFDSYTGLSPGRLRRFVERAGVPGYVVPAGLVGVGAAAVPHALSRSSELGLAPPWRVLASDPELPAWLVEVPHRARAYLAGPLVSLDPEGALAFLLAADPRREDRTAIEGPVPSGYLPPRGEARITEDRPARVEVEVDADRPALLVLNDQVLPGWRARVDGRDVPILAANYVARAVWVERGRHTVTFEYRTPLWREGWLVALAGLAASLSAAAIRRARRPVRGRTP